MINSDTDDNPEKINTCIYSNNLCKYRAIPTCPYTYGVLHLL